MKRKAGKTKMGSIKPGIAGALEDAMARGMKLTFRPIEEIVAGMEESIQEVEAEFTPYTPARLELGRSFRMKLVRLDVAFLAELEPWLKRKQVTFSDLVQALLEEWLKEVKGA